MKNSLDPFVIAFFAAIALSAGMVIGSSMYKDDWRQCHEDEARIVTLHNAACVPLWWFEPAKEV